MDNYNLIVYINIPYIKLLQKTVYSKRGYCMHVYNYTCYSFDLISNSVNIKNLMLIRYTYQKLY